MNLPFEAFLLALLIMPGVVFRRCYRFSEASESYHQPMTVAGSTSLVLALVLNFLWINLFILFDKQGELDFFKFLVAGQESFDDFIEKLNGFFFYISSLLAFSAISGSVIRAIIISLRLELISPFYQAINFDTPWYYFFKGLTTITEDSEMTIEDLVIKNKKRSLKNLVRTVFFIEKKKEYFSDKKIYILVSCTVKQPNCTFLYVGSLMKFYLKKENGELDRIILGIPFRRTISDESDKAELALIDEPSNDENSIFSNYFRIEADYIVIKYSEISTMSIRFLKSDESFEKT